MPLWIPAENAVFNRFDIGKALADGLRFRPLAETVRDTLAWSAARPADYTWRGGLTPEREGALLEEWHRGRGPIL
jgi:2'-hydroxyisoflavone reductase